MEPFRLESYLNDLKYLVNFDNGSYNAAGVRKVATFFEKKFAGTIWKTELIPVEGGKVGPCLKATNTDTDDYDVVLLGHMDTVFGDGEAAKRPYAIDEKGIVTGVGVSDMKGCLLLGFYALAELTNAGKLEGTKICFLFNSDEETGSKYSGRLVERIARHAKHCICIEAARGNGAMVKARSGIADYDLMATGKAAHAGNNPQEGSSAIHELAHWIIELHKLSNYAVGTSVNVGVIRGGTGRNVVADHAEAEVDVRFKSQAEHDRVKQGFEALAKQQFTSGGAKVTYAYRLNRPPMEATPASLAICDRVSALAKELGMEDVSWVRAGGGSDANTTAAMGIPTIDGAGPVGAGGHSAREWLDSKSVEPRMRLLEETILYLCGKRK